MTSEEEFDLDTLTNINNLGFDLKEPCLDCPFRTDSPFHSGIAKELPRLTESIDEGNLVHSCHKTDPRADGFTKLDKGKIQHCAGMMIMEIKDKEDVTMPMLLYGKLDYDNHGMDMDAPVFNNIQDMVDKYIEMAEDKKNRLKRETWTTDDGLTISIQRR